jgi:hypothetical protein
MYLAFDKFQHFLAEILSLDTIFIFYWLNFYILGKKFIFSWLHLYLLAKKLYFRG